MLDRSRVASYLSASGVWADRLGVGGLFLFALFAFLGTAGAYIGLGMMVLGALLDARRFGAACRLEPLLWVFVFFVAALLISTAAAMTRSPEAAARHWEEGGALLKLWGFVLVAWWLGGREQRLWWVLALALAGFLLGRVKALSWDEAAGLLQGLRSGLGLRPIAFGQYAATALLGVVLLAPRVYRGARQRLPGVWPGVVAAAWLLLAIALLQGVIVAQSRGIWLICAVLFPVLLLMQWREHCTAVRQRGSVVLLAMLTAGVLVIYSNSDVIMSRFALDKTTYARLWAGDFARIDYEPIQSRLRMIQLGLQWWWERPWLGWGPGATPYLLLATGDPILVQYNDLHNGYVEMLVRLGLAGLAPLVLVVCGVFLALWRAYRQHDLSRDLFLLVLGALLLHLLGNVSNFRMLNIDWRFYWLLFAGAAYTFQLRGRTRGDAASTSR
jgi:O-antigen ligase